MIYNPWIDFHSYLRIRNSKAIHMDRDIQSNIQYNMDSDQGTENYFETPWQSILLDDFMVISHLGIFSVTICDTVPIVTTATWQAGILLKKAVIFTCNSRLLILTFWINWSCCCASCRLAHSLRQKAIYKKAKHYHCWTWKFLKLQELSMEWPNRRQMIHSQQKWMYISDLTRVLRLLMHDHRLMLI